MDTLPLKNHQLYNKYPKNVKYVHVNEFKKKFFSKERNILCYVLWRGKHLHKTA